MTKSGYWDISDGQDKINYGVNKDEKTGVISKYNKLTSDTNVDNDHDRLFYKTQTGVTGYHGDESKIDKSQYGKDFDDFENNYGYHRR